MSVTITSHPTQYDQYSYIAQYIKHIIEEENVCAEDIAIIARKHKFLESLACILNNDGISINYERKDNILQDPTVLWLTAYLKLIVNLSKGRHDDVDYLIPEILSHEFWQLHPFIIYDISLKAYNERKNWLTIMKSYTCSIFDHADVNESVSEKIKHIADTFLHLSTEALIQPVEVILDYILGNRPLILRHETTHVVEEAYTDDYASDKSYEEV